MTTPAKEIPTMPLVPQVATATTEQDKMVDDAVAALPKLCLDSNKAVFHAVLAAAGGDRQEYLLTVTAPDNGFGPEFRILVDGHELGKLAAGPRRVPVDGNELHFTDESIVYEDDCGLATWQAIAHYVTTVPAEETVPVASFPFYAAPKDVREFTAVETLKDGSPVPFTQRARKGMPGLVYFQGFHEYAFGRGSAGKRVVFSLPCSLRVHMKWTKASDSTGTSVSLKSMPRIVLQSLP